jgi:hypothetical protein
MWRTLLIQTQEKHITMKWTSMNWHRLVPVVTFDCESDEPSRSITASSLLVSKWSYKKFNVLEISESQVLRWHSYLVLGSSLEQSCEEDHFFLSSAVSWECCLRMDRPQPAVRLPRRENARFTIGELGTLLGLQSETRHSSSPHTQNNMALVSG